MLGTHGQPASSSILLPPALQSLPWFIPFSRPPPPSTHPFSPPGSPALCSVGTDRAQAAHRRPRRWATGNAGLAPHTCSLLAQGLGQSATQHTHTDTPPQTQMWIRRRFISLNLLNFPTYRPNLGELVGGGGECGWDYTCKYSHRPL